MATQNRVAPGVAAPPELAGLLAAERQEIGQVRETPVTALDAVRMDKLRGAIKTFSDGRRDGTLAATPRREVIPVPNSRPQAQAPAELLSPRQQRALEDLRWRAERSVDVRVIPADRSIRLLAGCRLGEPATVPEAGHTLSGTTARQFMRRNADLFALTDPDTEMKIVREEKDALGITHVRIRQQWQGVEVYPADAMVQLDQFGAVTLFMGTYRPTPETSEVTPDISMEDGRAIARQAVRDASKMPVPGAVKEESLVLFAPDPAAEPRLAWQHLIHGGMLTDWHTFVDAKTGVVPMPHSIGGPGP